MEQSFRDRVVIVTGGAGAIGRATCLHLASLGAGIVVNDVGSAADGNGLSAAPADQVVAQIKAADGTAVAHSQDIGLEEAATALVELAVNTFGRVDAVVNNAGILRDRIFHKMTADDFSAVLAVHLTGYFHVSLAAARKFRAQGSGAFVHMTSNSALIGNIAQANYSSAKAGVLGLSRSIALDMRRFGVRSNAVAPTAWSRLTATIPPGDPRQGERLLRLKPEAVAQFVRFLISDAAADITGQVFSVRGNEVHLMSQPRPVQSYVFSDLVAGEQRDFEPMCRSAVSALVPLEESKDVFRI